MYIDLEDSDVGIVSRLLDLGVDPAVIADPRRFAYVRPEEAFRDDARAGFWAMLEEMQPSLVVLDSTGESMALEGTDPNSDVAVADWFNRVGTALAKRGPAVLLVDHLPKSDSTASSPIGSQRKRAAISGVQMIQSVPAQMAFARGRAGQARLTCTKDRHGHFVTGELALLLTVNPEPARGETGVSIELSRATEGGEPFAHTRVMLKITEFLGAATAPQTTSAIKAEKLGKAQTVLSALSVLVLSGYVSESAGARGAKLYELIKPYQLGDPYDVPEGDEPDATGRTCMHPWHNGEEPGTAPGRCNPGWCHHGHHGSCNESYEGAPEPIETTDHSDPMDRPAGESSGVGITYQM